MKKVVKTIISLNCLIGALVAIIEAYTSYRINITNGIVSFIGSMMLYLVSIILFSYIITSLNKVIKNKTIDFNNTDLIVLAISLVTFFTSSFWTITKENIVSKEDYIMKICNTDKGKCTYIKPKFTHDKETNKSKFVYEYTVSSENNQKNIKSMGVVNRAEELLSISKIYKTEGTIILNEDYTIYNEETNTNHDYKKGDILSEEEFKLILKQLTSLKN